MPTCTPIYGLTVPTGSDSPCTLGDTFCEFHNGVDTQLDLIDDLVNRTQTSVPMVKVSTDSTGVLVLNAPTFPVPFDTVEVDTANMFNASDPFRIIFPRDGVYLLGANIQALTTGTVNQTGLTLSIYPDPPDVGWGGSSMCSEGLIFTSGVGVCVSTGLSFPFTAGTGAFCQVFPFVQGTDTMTIQHIEMFAIWMGDLA